MEEEISSNGIIITKNLMKIGARKVFLQSGEIHYFRTPPEEWEDRLTKAKSMGLNAISTYIYWNFHEEESGKFDITSMSKDLDHFLHLCENKGFYIIIRPGPSIGSDLSNGGIPQWLLNEHPKILSLNENYKPSKWKSKQFPPISYLSPTYLRMIEKYINNISDVLRRHLYPHGGLILLQIDNKMCFGSNVEIFDLDYNPVALEFYKKFLKGKYHDIEEINQYYSQNFLSFDHIEPPSKKTQEDAINSQNEFKSRGECLRLIDWMELKERILQEYVANISYFLRKRGVFLPYFVNVPFLGSPVNIKEFYHAYKTKIHVGLDFDEEFLLDIKKTEGILESNIEILKSQMPLFPFIPELKIGSSDKLIPPNNVHLLIRLVLGNGIKGLNYYMGAGGITPSLKSLKGTSSILTKSIGYEGESHYVDKTGVSYDYGAPIGMNGQKNSSYEVIELTTKYIRANEDKLLTAEKVYDDDIVILSYHPYSRLNFNTSKLGFISDFQSILQNNPHPEFTLLKEMGLHPAWLDLETTSFEQLHRHKIAVIVFSAFLDRKSMELLRRFVEEGGILISFLDIPTRNEKMIPDETLSTLFGATIQKRENEKYIIVNGEKITAFNHLYSFKLIQSKKNKPNKHQKGIIACDDSSHTTKVYAFRQSVNKGQIFHFGFIPSIDKKNVQVFEEILSSVKPTPKKTIHSDELTVLRLQCDNKEELVTVANLTKNKLENSELIFHDVSNNDGENILHLKDVTILERSSIQWSINKKINENACVKACTSEINEVSKRVKKDSVHYFVSGFHFKGSKNILEVNLKLKPEKVISGKKDITKRIFKPDNKLRVQFSEMEAGKEKLYRISAVYSDDLQLSLHFGGKEKSEVLDFNIKRKNTFIDQLS